MLIYTYMFLDFSISEGCQGMGFAKSPTSHEKTQKISRFFGGKISTMWDLKEIEQLVDFSPSPWHWQL